MLNTLKNVDNKFNLLYLEYSECLFNSIQAYAHKITDNSKVIEKGTLHINSHSLAFDSDDISTPLVKLTIDNHFFFKSFKFEDMVLLYKEYQDHIKSKDKNSQNPSLSPNIFQIMQNSKQRKSTRIGSQISINNNNISSNQSTSQIINPPNNQQNSTIGRRTSLRGSAINQIGPSPYLSHFSSNQNTRQISLKISEFGDLLNLALKGENMSTGNNVNVVNQNILALNINLNTEHSYLQSTRAKKSAVVAPNNNQSFIQNSLYVDLYNYFHEHSINILSFLEIFHNINKTFSKIDKKNNSFCILIIKTSSVKTIDREKFKHDNLNLQSPKSYMMIIEGKIDEIKLFLNDVFVFTEAITNHREDESGLINIVSARKVEELKANYIVDAIEGDEVMTNRVETIKIENDGGIEVVSVNVNNVETSKMTPSSNPYRDHLAYTSPNSPEKVIFHASALRILPEKYQNGLFILHQRHPSRESSNSTDCLCEFIPVDNSICKKALKFYLHDIKVFLSYRYYYQLQALNIFLYNRKRSKIIYFLNENDYEFVNNFLSVNCTKLDLSFSDVSYHTNLWVDGLLTNYDYLMYLNTMAGRSFSDLSQYPIMPWVLTNYKDQVLNLNDARNFRDLSKPMGALNPERLKECKEKFNEVQYLFRNYFSFPFIVFYYLIRTSPHFFLRYQTGSFGPSDRIFFSIQECWNSTVCNLGTDVKELIPEFYDSEANGEFLKNLNAIHFGKTQAGIVVNDVILPPWAKSPNDFIKIMRCALESEIASNSLHLWIDLIFGYKQRGEQAVNANNVFYYLRYDDCISQVLEKNEEERQSALDDIMECGQIPIQLFTEPHPKKRSRFSWKEKGSNGQLSEVNQHQQERAMIEKKYEKERREKEEKMEKVKKIFQEKEKTYLEQMKSIKETVIKKETEFKAYIASLTDRAIQLKQHFAQYDSLKEKLINDWVTEIKKKHDKIIEGLFEDNKNLFKYIKSLESIVKKYENEKREMEEKIEKLTSDISTQEALHKQLQEEYYAKHKIVRHYPPEIQVTLAKLGNYRQNVPQEDNVII